MTDTVDNEWDADRYDSQMDFVAAHGESLLDRLDPQPGERVLDLGCGTGELTAEIGRAVGPEGEAVGIDQSAEMITSAREAHPECRFERSKHYSQRGGKELDSGGRLTTVPTAMHHQPMT